MSKTVLLQDFGNRSASNTWGTPVVGPAYTMGGGPAADYSVSGGLGTFSLSALNVQHSALAAINALNVDLRCDVTLNALPVGANVEVGIRARYVDGNNFVDVRLFMNTGNTITMAIRQLVGGVETFVGFFTVPQVGASTTVSVRLVAFGSQLLGKAWAAGSPEPALWMAQMTTTMLTAGGVFLYCGLPAGLTNTLPVPLRFANLLVLTGVTPLGFVYPTDADTLCGTGAPVVTALEQLADSVQAFLTASDMDAMATESALGVPSSQVFKQDLVLTTSNNPWSGPVDTVVFNKNTPTDYGVYQSGVILGSGVWWVLVESITAQNSAVTTGFVGSDGNARVTYPITISANGANPEYLGGGSQDLKLFRTLPERAVSVNIQATGNVAASNPLVTVVAQTSVQVSENVT